MHDRKRVIILTDISSLEGGVGEPDDTQSLIRFLLYADEFDVEGLAATYTSHGRRTNPQYIRQVLTAYGEVLPMLRKHNAGFPSMDELMSKVCCGSNTIGLEHVGANGDTESSEQIIRAADREDERPVWVLIWGGSIDLAQAIWKICHTRDEEQARLFKKKLRVYAISDQYDRTGQWIRTEHPDIFYITADISFRGMYRGGDERYCQAEWIRENICRGPLGSLYPIYDGGDPWGEVRGLKEGDSPSFLYLLDSSPGNPENPVLPGWGGQFVQRGRQYFDLPDRDAAMESVYRWREAYQKDFAQRIKWTLE